MERGGVEVEGGGATASTDVGASTRVGGRLGSVGGSDRVAIEVVVVEVVGVSDECGFGVRRDEGVGREGEESKRGKEASQFYCCSVSFGLARGCEEKSGEGERHGYTSSQ